MKAWIRQAWDSRAPRERRSLAILFIVLTVALYLSLITSAERERSRLHASVPLLQVQALKFSEHAAEYERLRGALPPSVSTAEGDLRMLLQAQVDAAGLSQALGNIDTLDADKVQVIFNDVPFVEWLAWVAAMQLQSVRLVSGRIQALPEQGFVNVRAVFIRSSAE